MLEIKNLHASIDDKPILNGINLAIGAGETHAIMGPNGSGKSTLSHIITCKSGYEVTQGDILFQGKSILALNTAERATAGIFLSLQYPVEIPGLSNLQFLKAALNSQRKARNESELQTPEFMKKLRALSSALKIDQDFLKRGVNEGFSGGEKKRNEILQMMMLEPKLCILDETDSGLDIDALQIVANGANQMMSPDRSFLVITHYQRLLDYIRPDYIHVLSEGQIIKSGDHSLALMLEEKGYGWIDEN